MELISRAGAIPPMRVLIIGAGITGSLIAAFLRRRLPFARIEITVVDKGRRAGGRMATSRRPDAFASEVDSGAQYLTQRTTVGPVGDAWMSLLRAGAIAPLVGDILGDTRPGAANFVAIRGMDSIPKTFLVEAQASVRPSTTVRRLMLARAADAPRLQRWRAEVDTRHDEGGTPSLYDAVFCTIPTPQLLALGGDVASVLAEAQLDTSLRAVTYSSRYALILHFNLADADAVRSALPYVARYVADDLSGDGAAKFICFDSEKRTRALAAVRSDGHADTAALSPTVIVHSSVDFGARLLEADPSADVAPLMLAQLLQLQPGLPSPAFVKCHRWRYSQVTRGFLKAPGAVAVPVRQAAGVGEHESQQQEIGPALILAGDAFDGNSNFEGCARSAAIAVDLLASTSAAWNDALRDTVPHA